LEKLEKSYVNTGLVPLISEKQFVALVWSSSQLTHNDRYDAYGRLIPAPGNWTDPHNPYTFLGKAWDEHLGLYEFGVRLYDPWAGVWLTREPLPGAAWRPRTWHRYAYAFASPISYYDAYGMRTAPYGAWAAGCLLQVEDPLCRAGTPPPPGVSPEEHARLCATRAIALALSRRVRAGGITDVDALARLFEETRSLYEQRFLFFYSYNVRAHIWDLAVIVGGLEVRFPDVVTFVREGWTYVRAGRLAHPEAFFEIIENPQDPSSPYSPYYLGYQAFGATGFREEYRESREPRDIQRENQVRHFMGGVAGAFFYGEVGERLLLSREEPGSPDYRLYQEGAFPLAYSFSVFTFLTGGAPPGIGDWIRQHIGIPQAEQGEGR